ncbi:seminal metalloprotease 1-like [Uranotaenia lowii]|uniref:seminal metalloprotease 1-like n=1 Tax=Uranotaenia lowii TaxID=190385 RepID=UPI002479F252|nr:seminal metalloprotease 1-like [Uranotaenia lowii]
MSSINFICAGILFWTRISISGSEPPESSTENLQLEAETEGGFFEGDMELTPEQYAELKLGRNGLILQKYRWPSKVVPYVISEDHFEKEGIAKIRKAMRRIEKVSCVKFQPRSGQTAYVRFTGDKPGCYSTVGHSGKVQELNLSPKCIRVPTMMHEMLHTLGFYHMQSASNRDKYVRIQWKNIKKGHRHNFIKYGFSAVSDFGTPYDYASLMHYPPKSFSKNGRRTIVPLKDVVIGQRKGLSKIDIIKLNKMYKC